jgi:uncharacterized protein
VIDVFPHVMPRGCYERFRAAARGHVLDIMHGLEAVAPLAALWDLDARFRAMDRIPGCVQVLTMCIPPVEELAEGQAGADLARLANDSMAELVAKHPDRFRGFAASLLMSDPDAALAEIDRATRQLGALGIQIFTNVAGCAPDEPRFEPVFARMAELDKPIWVHGWRHPARPDYAGEAESRYGLWLGLGWPYEMGMFCARMVLSGVFLRHPNLRILTHHSGGMAAAFARRVGAGHQFQPRQTAEKAALEALAPHPAEHIKRFYADTTGQSPIAINGALRYFGSEHVLMGTDFPWNDPSAHLATLAQLNLSEADRQLLLEANAELFLSHHNGRG